MTRTRGEMPCLNCRLIEMGEMACYQVRHVVTQNNEIIMSYHNFSLGPLSSVQSSATLQVGCEARLNTRSVHFLI